MAGRISFILNQAEIARGPVDAQKFLSAAHNLLREKGLILKYGLVSVIEWEKFEKAVSEVSHKAITKGIKGHDFEEIRRKSGIKEIMMTLETKLADNQKVIEREEGMNSQPGWIKKTAIGLAAVVGLGIGSANLPNDYVGIGPTSAYAEESSLSENEAESLNENDYRRKIDVEKKCIVLYYKTNTLQTHKADSLIREFKKNIPSVKFFKVNVDSFSKQEKAKVIEDIGENVSPAIILYRGGIPVIKSGSYENIRICGPPKENYFKLMIEIYSNETR